MHRNTSTYRTGKHWIATRKCNYLTFPWEGYTSFSLINNTLLCSCWFNLHHCAFSNSKLLSTVIAQQLLESFTGYFPRHTLVFFVFCVFLCCFTCLFWYGPICLGALKLNMSTLLPHSFVERFTVQLTARANQTKGFFNAVPI